MEALSQLLMSAAAITVVTLLTKAIYHVFLSPVARSNIPGPAHVAASNAWFDYQGLRTNRVRAMHCLFEEYGPVVRIGPNRVAFADPAVVREIYRTHTFRKGDTYSSLTFGGTQNSFNTADPTVHAQFRRWSAPAFRGDNVHASGIALQDELCELLERVKQDSKDRKPIDILRLFRNLSLDMLGITVLGTRFNQIASGKNHEFTHLPVRWVMDKVLVHFLPDPVYKLLKALPSVYLRGIFDADSIMCALAAELYDAASGDNDSDLQKGVNILETCKAYRDPVTDSSTPKDLVVGEAAVFLTAGTDTMGLAFTYTAYELAKRADIWVSLREELARVPIEMQYDIDILRGLPYLNAFIREVLRVWGPGNAFLERVVPEGGATLAGYFIPGGTKIGGPAWSCHFNEHIFPDPYKIKPERWLEHGAANLPWTNRAEATVSDMRSALFFFGHGVRSCAGRPLAEIEMLLVTATLARNFKLDVDEKTTEASMRLVDMGVLLPMASEVLIVFEHDPIVCE